MLPSSFCNNMHDPFVDIKMEQQNYGLHHDQDHMVDVAEDHSPQYFLRNDYGDSHVQMGPMDSRPMQPSFENSSPPAPIPLHRPILPLAPAPALSKPPHTRSGSRRTLTDSERRRMCEYHSENPNVKQTEIGGGCGILSYLRSTC